MDLVPFTTAIAGACRSRPQAGRTRARRARSSPKLRLLDEPAAGLNHEEIDVLKAR